MMWTIFALLLCGIAKVFQKPTEETINPNKKDSLFPVTTSTKVSSNLRDILNQESLVRLSMVQKMQSMAMDALDIKNKVETLTENLKKVTEELRTTKAENQKQRKEIADLEKARENLSAGYWKLNTTQADESNKVETLTENLKKVTEELRTTKAENQKQQKEVAELKKARENLSVKFQKLKTIQVDESNEMLQLRRDYQNFSIAVNETLKNIRLIQNESNVQLMNITSQVQSGESGMHEPERIFFWDTSNQIQFDTSFEETPSVTLGFVELCNTGSYPTYSRVSDVTKSGFSISVSGAVCKISWMACGN